VVYINTLILQEVLKEPGWMERMESEDIRALTPLIYSHVNTYGLFRLNMAERLPLEVVYDVPIKSDNGTAKNKV
jgi:Tn3 transposase DDE domain